MTQVEVRSVRLGTRYIHQPVDATKRFDKLGVCHPCTIDPAGLMFRQWGPWARTAVPVKQFVEALWHVNMLPRAALASPGCAVPDRHLTSAVGRSVLGDPIGLSASAPPLVSPPPLKGQAPKGSRMGNNLWRELPVYLLPRGRQPARCRAPVAERRLGPR